MFNIKTWSRRDGTGMPSSVGFYFDKLSPLVEHTSITSGKTFKKKFTYNPEIGSFDMLFEQAVLDGNNFVYTMSVEINGNYHKVFELVDGATVRAEIKYVDLMDIVNTRKPKGTAPDPRDKEIERLNNELNAALIDNRSLKSKLNAIRNCFS
jgi:hypothetical protein